MQAIKAPACSRPCMARATRPSLPLRAGRIGSVRVQAVAAGVPQAPATPLERFARNPVSIGQSVAALCAVQPHTGIFSPLRAQPAAPGVGLPLAMPPIASLRHVSRANHQRRRSGRASRL